MATPTKRITVTALRRQKINMLSEFMEEFGIEATQVVVLPRPAGKRKAVYCKESAIIVKRFFEIYKEEMSKSIVMFHDCANFLSSVCDSLIDEGLLGENVEYPAAIHQYLSPNDNTLHGAAKSIWRNSEHYEGDQVTDVRSSLYLLSQLGRFEPKVVSGRFQKNFFLDKLMTNITKDECRELIGNSGEVNKERREFFDKTKDVYEKWVSGKTSRRYARQPVPHSMIPGDLDGEYWMP